MESATPSAPMHSTCTDSKVGKRTWSNRQTDEETKHTMEEKEREKKWDWVKWVNERKNTQRTSLSLLLHTFRLWRHSSDAKKVAPNKRGRERDKDDDRKSRFQPNSMFFCLYFSFFLFFFLVFSSYVKIVWAWKKIKREREREKLNKLHRSRRLENNIRNHDRTACGNSLHYFFHYFSSTLFLPLFPLFFFSIFISQSQTP